MASNDIDQIPSSIEKFIFAADLVNFIFYSNTPYNIILLGVEHYRDFAVSIFNDNMLRAVHFLNTMLRLQSNEIFDVTLFKNLGNGLYFKHCVKILKTEFFRDGYDPDSFLRYSVRLASLAAKCYLHGMEKAPELAVKYIFKAMKFDLSTGGIEKFDMLAQNYVTISKLEIHQPSPISEIFEVSSAAKNFKSTDDLKACESTTFKCEGAQYKEERVPNQYADNKNQHDDERIKAHPFQNQSLSSLNNTQSSRLDSATWKKFESNSAASNASPYLASSDYIPIPGTSRERDIDVIYLIPCFGSQEQNSVSKSQSKTCHSPGSTAHDERNSKKLRIDREDDERNSTKPIVDGEEMIKKPKEIEIRN